MLGVRSIYVASAPHVLRPLLLTGLGLAVEVVVLRVTNLSITCTFSGKSWFIMLRVRSFYVASAPHILRPLADWSFTVFFKVLSVKTDTNI